MKERKYPFRLFVMGLLMNMLLRYSWLLIPGVILVVVGKWISVCLYIGLALLIADVTLSFYDQMLIRKTMLSDSENEVFRGFQEAVSKDGSGFGYINDLINNAVAGSAVDEEQDTEE